MGVLSAQVEIGVPANKAWEIYRDNHLMMNVNPDLLCRVQYLQGDGSPGSIRFLKLGPKVGSYVEESKEKIEKVEEKKNGCREVTYRVIDGELKKMYDPYIVTFSFSPLAGEAGRCIASWKAEYQRVNPSIPPPEKAQNAALSFLKAIEDFYVNRFSQARIPQCN